MSSFSLVFYMPYMSTCECGGGSFGLQPAFFTMKIMKVKSVKSVDESAFLASLRLCVRKVGFLHALHVYM